MMQSISNQSVQMQADAVLANKQPGWKRLALFGPALVAAVAYVDPFHIHLAHNMAMLFDVWCVDCLP